MTEESGTIKEVPSCVRCDHWPADNGFLKGGVHENPQECIAWILSDMGTSIVGFFNDYRRENFS